MIPNRLDPLNISELYNGLRKRLGRKAFSEVLMQMVRFNNLQGWNIKKVTIYLVTLSRYPIGNMVIHIDSPVDILRCSLNFQVPSRFLGSETDASKRMLEKYGQVSDSEIFSTF